MDISRFVNFKDIRRLIIDVVILSLLGILLLYLGKLLGNVARFEFITKSPEPIRIVVFFIWLVLLFIFFRTFISWLNKLLKRDKVYLFTSKDWPNEWIFNGRPELENSTDLHIQSSRAGCLLKNYLWKDFQITFEMKFVDNPFKHIGILFRAEDLDNYFMLEITQDSPFRKDSSGNNKSGLIPHIKYQGGWEVTDLVRMDSSFNFSEFVNLKIEVKNNIVNCYFKNKLVLNWVLPTHVDIMYKESGVQNGDSTEGKLVRKETFIYVKELPFRCGYGMVGFRAAPSQGAIIRGLKIKPL